MAALDRPGTGMDDDPGFAVYVHWPFCASKCPYCDFNSHVRFDPPDQPRFVAAFDREIAYWAERSGKRKISSIFFGGGTPSLMEPKTVGAILEAIERRWDVASNVEITLEANPTSVEATRFAGFRAAGINRVSMGVQSLNDADLKTLGRLHTAAEALKAISVARAHFKRYSFDLIYARPGQTVEGWKEELNRAIDEAAEHLSLYQLTIEEGTPFHALHAAGKLVVPDDDTSRALYDLTQQVTAARGLPAYEISNHARLGAECRHNMVYWRSGDFVGVGPGAHGRVTLDDRRIATSNEKSPETWLSMVEKQNESLVIEDRLTSDQNGDEFLVMGLRLVEGIDPARFTALTGRGLSRERINSLVADGLLAVSPNGRLRVTAEGFPVLDFVVADLAMDP